MSTFIEARVIQKVDTEANWMANPLKLYQGEVAFVSDKYNFKLNTTDIPKTFAELEYYYKGDIISGVLPTDDLASKPDGVYRATISGTYGGVVVKEGYYTLLRKTAGVWSLESEVKMPAVEVDQEFNESSENAISSKAVINASTEIVEEAFKGTTSTNITIGRDLNTYGEPSTNIVPFDWPLVNNTLTPVSGKITKIRINVESAGSMKLGLCAINPETKTMVVKQQLTYTLVAGINEITVDLTVDKGDTIGSYGGPCEIRFIDETTDTGKYYSDSSNPFQWKKGAVCINFDFESADEEGYTVKQIKNILSSVGSSSVESSQHARICIEGQSNAFGVGYLSGLLNNEPYNTVPFSWGLKFSRVFIFNPRTNNYENLQIGVNNMASWDADYVNPSISPTPEPTYGPEIGIALIWQNSTKRGNLFIDKNVGDGRPIEYFQKGTAYYTTLLSRRTASNNWLNNRCINAPTIGFIWVQGEANAGSSSTSYLASLNQLIGDRKEDLVFSENTRIVLAQGNFGTGVKQAQSQYTSGDLKSAIVNYPPYYNSDAVHLNHRGQLELGLNSGIFLLFADNVNFEQLDKKIYWTF